ncbi:MAG: UDP-3-O-acyl-N-acetylglucosamine deacetylase [Deltaproteobacteria bacterium]|nr:UDP-3-O-acyl-N-acetylglucosamine deacetylase [Deltaproteobacteria bacterium]
MSQNHQHTLATHVSSEGVGLHTGAPIRLTLRPADAGAGIVFRRTDVARVVEIPARLSHVVDTRLATMIGRDGVTLSTVEHVLAALWACGVDNAVVDVTGPEVPVMDGSAGPWVELVEQAGLVAQTAARRVARVAAPVEVRDGDKRASVRPGVGLSVACAIDFRHPLITQQQLSLTVDGEVFRKDLAHARTFGFLHEVEMLRKAGLARGGSLENAVVVDRECIMNPEGLRFQDEFVRHKILDALGDLYLLGAPMMGCVELHKAGHALHVALGRAILQQDAVEWILASDLPAPVAARYRPRVKPAQGVALAG